MKTYLDCFPCVLRQSLDAVRVATSDPAVQRRVLDEVMRLLTELELDVSPPEIAQKVHRVVRRVSGEEEPYAGIKRLYNERALRLIDALRPDVEGAPDPLERAARLAVAGNVIDFGAEGKAFDLERECRAVLEAEFARYDYADFRRDLLEARALLYLGDNAGEIAFDRLLVEEIRRLSRAEITFVVRGRPVLNDATLEDARFVGLDRLVRVIDNGSDAPATVLSEVRPEVRRLFETADVIIAKGQGNYETLNEEPADLYFLLKAKCPVLAAEAGVKVGEYLIARGRGSGR